VRSALGVVPAAVALAGYAYWATEQPPFGALAYVAAGLPVLVVAWAMLFGGRGRLVARRSLLAPATRRAWPWLLIAAAMAGLEAVGLALGGRSADVPTLSTVVDHALGWHLTRLLLFVGWLLIGCAVVGDEQSNRPG